MNISIIIGLLILIVALILTVMLFTANFIMKNKELAFVWLLVSIVNFICILSYFIK